MPRVSLVEKAKSKHKIITVEKLGKKYLLRHHRTEAYTTLRDVLTVRPKNLFGGTKTGKSLRRGMNVLD
jgi:hypothetical protein